MTKALRAKPALVFLPYLGNVALYLLLLMHGARATGVFISAIMSATGLVFIYLTIKNGFVFGRGRRYSVDDQPRAFWASAVFCFLWYLVVTFIAVGFYFQDHFRGIIA